MSTDSQDELSPAPLRLDQFLKLSGMTSTGGQAKIVIQAGEVTVNGEVETRRRRKLAADDIVQFEGQVLTVKDYFLPE